MCAWRVNAPELPVPSLAVPSTCVVCSCPVGGGAAWVWPHYPHLVHETCLPWHEQAFPYRWVMGRMKAAARQCDDRVHRRRLREAAAEVARIEARWNRQKGSLGLLSETYAVIKGLGELRRVYRPLWHLPG